ncbi:MAG TPA: hypothetical protein VIC28_17855 [Thermoanaerobaculia bacterium]|jgi:carboxypeptidase C (cathepsin A)
MMKLNGFGPAGRLLAADERTPAARRCAIVPSRAAANGDFRVFAATGYHDLTTTFYGVEHTFNHSGIPRDRLTLKNYFGGHMMYLNEASLAALSADIRAFIRGR